ncbi:MAG: DUF4399 domain-containing protein [Gemmatimonadetes bacterium]|nr:DUF4399 domain-containing protein [Gemmatimonadota bacterium]
MTRRMARLAGLVALLVACGGQADAPAGDLAATAPAVEIVAPADGATIDGGQVGVELSVANLTIVPAGDQTPSSGHHHLFLDRDASPAGEIIPAEAGYIVHLGTGATTYTFENVASGEHRPIAVVADFAHVPLQPWVVDTVRFTVR